MPAAAQAVARIGPNAVIQLAAPLEAALGPAEARALFTGAGYAALPDPAEGLIPVAGVARLFGTVAARLGAGAPQVLGAAGAATGAYVLAHRIPAPAQTLLRALPPAMAAALLVRAIGRNAWTFAGSGRVRVHGITHPVIEIAGNPLAGNCAWHRGVFDTLFQSLAGESWHSVETVCCAHGGAACRFEMRPHNDAAPLRRASAAPRFGMSRKGLWR